jgi:hypothetical protein
VNVCWDYWRKYHNELEADRVTALISRLQCLFLHIDSGVEDSRNGKALQFLKTVGAVSQCPLRCISSKWIDSVELKAAMDGLKHDLSEDRRTVLLVSGLNLEDQVTVCALEALLEGFDVHLLCDVMGKTKQLHWLKSLNPCIHMSGS